MEEKSEKSVDKKSINKTKKETLSKQIGGDLNKPKETFEK